MPKFRKKPVVIEAFRYNGGSVDGFGYAKVGDEECLIIATLEGDMRANVGDWIITGVKGEKYPCKPDIFDATYEAADD